ncbi:hypothetical protein ETB97_006278 [Aspergillus alliaceus]|uniref:Siderophore biosynthesis enzyme n=1 Tax=Petromyces alliaceus TaxID=209559 RepID=A0A5N6G5X0_PETAA|nr:uncharacterized protein BDW43DRAFT_266664 [Aspergillus alliaceus]KAB8237005.1 hypothetical protein BDW43DRAFT_266664 [Aspergillus alliaceus]KAE8390903.1 hypothetical protein BDV23DRAFT_154106 [Aspergillus alliaceus]KAF5857099.1 hypothetical protein ETB97_006278 [Aspergillus burnettii]
MKSFTLPILLAAGLAAARTDLVGCTKSATVNQWGQASMIWYVPDTGEICDFPDCGGGRAPPKHNQPGCAAYTGTETLTPSYLPGWGPNGKVAPSTSALSASVTDSESSTMPTSAASSNTKTGSTLITAAPTLSSGASSSAAAGSSSLAASSSSAASSRSSLSSTSGSPSSSGTSNATSSSGARPTGNAASVSVSNVASVLAFAGALVGVMAL